MGALIRFILQFVPIATLAGSVLCLGVFSIASCGGPQQPATQTEPGALAQALGAPPVAQANAPAGLTGALPPELAPIPYIIIRFERPGLTFEDTLYSALTRALERYPDARFDVVLAMPPLSPTGDPKEAMQLGEQHIEDVVLAMTDMGMPSDRLRIAASTDENAKVDEIRIFVR